LYCTSEDSKTKDELELILGKEISLYKISEAVILESLNRYYQKPTNRVVHKVKSVSEDFIHQIIIEARSLNSSDIHFEPFENLCRVRLRIDGQLIERYTIENKDYPALVNKIKIKSNLDIAEKRLPQDGRLFFNENGIKTDIRVSVMPTLFGEKVVLRLLSKDTSALEINDLGFSKIQLEHYKKAINQPYGIILISGPTGSGKTTTLYATLKILNDISSNILTIEDPIEYTLEGINQVQLNESIGLSFAKALRTFLRQDPDIIMLGEIRDDETAQMAIRSALTGHLVLSTIHTNTAIGIISRLTDMGIPPFLINSTLNLAVSQRLIRLLCDNCKKEVEINETKYQAIQSKNIDKLYEPVGCSNCFYTGFKGRKAIYEVIPISEEIIKNKLKETYSTNEFMVENQLQSLIDSALNLLRQGVTSFDEIYPILISKQSD
jgi:general secretion pathway protein E/type IV pilus assembly protein PilB